ncbi:uncharacterized protein N7484_009733 [Penicillium longicatenatum]|uniref:uncharacterized protein n=1 Tax=Penicillium longicatenatum TaxID=1561947 RepID=UPI0025499979|nr:uncharacterized protein N7484_009733 [Penicillium longicatenatum]KAJ5636420.1 hypothetical protein N7484_009733 [Penicillium longicatenatum]
MWMTELVRTGCEEARETAFCSIPHTENRQTEDETSCFPYVLLDLPALYETAINEFEDQSSRHSRSYPAFYMPSE